MNGLDDAEIALLLRALVQLRIEQTQWETQHHRVHPDTDRTIALIARLGRSQSTMPEAYRVPLG